MIGVWCTRGGGFHRSRKSGTIDDKTSLKHIIPKREILMPCDSDDSLLSDEESSEFLRDLRARRIQALKNAQTARYGSLDKLSHERDLLQATTGTHCLVMHFKDSTFKRCTIMTEHLQKLAQKYPSTRFVEIEASEAPFMVVKLNVKMLPLVVCVRDGLFVDR